jgi:hypothetical protein
MTPKLTWADLFLSGPEIDFSQLLSCWPQHSFGRIRPIGLSAFGDCYFECSDGSVCVLDTLDGNVRAVAKSFFEFSSLMNSPQWQEENLLSLLVSELHARGISRGSGQVFGFAPHPAFVGKIDLDRVMPLDAYVWHSICAQTFAQVPNSP